MATKLVVQHREQLLYLLTEAAEVEHNLMCCYLYAAFSLKSGESEGLTPSELAMVKRWRQSIVAVAVEEMTHLSLVANLLVAVGAAPHFGRPNLPVDPGFYPAGVVISLAPFDLGTAEHFAFLERPEGAEIQDGAGFDAHLHYVRAVAEGRLMPSAQDYATVGDLYRGIRAALDALVSRLGEAGVFLGDPSGQVGPERVSLPGLLRVTDLGSAHAAIDTIVSQGEGADAHREGSHFQRFSTILDEYRAALAARPDFAPARPVARNPVMRRPPRPEGRVFISDGAATRLLDLANATYGFMLRLLSQGFGCTEEATSRVLLDAAVDAMFTLVPVAEALTLLPASPDHPGVAAGVSFAMSRTLGRLPQTSATWHFLAERAEELARGFEGTKGHSPELGPDFAPFAERLRTVRARLLALPEGSHNPSDQSPTTSPDTTQPPAPPPPADPTEAGIDRIEAKGLTLVFEGKRCIHSRQCVLTLPQVFRANVQGPWIAPDAAPVDEVVALAHTCPSGAIRYERRDGGPEERPPAVNVVRVRENGPLAFAAELAVAGVQQLRATLCRCGASKNKPYCDGSHHGLPFQATGEPATEETPALATRNGPLTVKPLQNGPLHVTGNLEICAGTGRTIARVTTTALCRCGGSGKKPFCDGTHRRIGFEAPGA